MLFDNTQRAYREVYSFSSPWGRAHISSEIRDAIANLQSLYKLHGALVSDGPSDSSDESRLPSGRDPQNLSSAGREAPSYRAPVDIRASERSARSLPFHVTLIQDTFHVKTLTTVRILPWL